MTDLELLEELNKIDTSTKALIAEEDERAGRLLRVRGLQAVKAIMGGHQYMKK